MWRQDMKCTLLYVHVTKPKQEINFSGATLNTDMFSRDSQSENTLECFAVWYGFAEVVTARVDNVHFRAFVVYSGMTKRIRISVCTIIH